MLRVTWYRLANLSASDGFGGRIDLSFTCAPSDLDLGSIYIQTLPVQQCTQLNAYITAGDGIPQVAFPSYLCVCISYEVFSAIEKSACFHLQRLQFLSSHSELKLSATVQSSCNSMVAYLSVHALVVCCLRLVQRNGEAYLHGNPWTIRLVHLCLFVYSLLSWHVPSYFNTILSACIRSRRHIALAVGAEEVKPIQECSLEY